MSLARVRLVSSSALLLALVTPANATDWELALDVRAVDSNGRNSYLDGAQGKLRFDAASSGLQLGRFRAAVTQPIGELFAIHAEATSWGDDDLNPIDLTEAFLEYRPYPSAGGWRTRVRAGAFWPPFSLESRAKGWETPYTLTPSAIGSWLGEEIRTIGVEGQAEWLGTRLGHSFDLQLTGALFGANDPAGTMIAVQGFALSDRQTTLFGRSAHKRVDMNPNNEMFLEIDHRVGFYVGAQARYFDRVFLDVLRYDNRGDPTAYNPSNLSYAWDTRFTAAALRVETQSGWTALVQGLTGVTYVTPGGFALGWRFHSSSTLLAKRHGPHQLAVRYDDFDVDTQLSLRARDRPGNEHGNAFVTAYSWEPDETWRITLEWLRVRSNVATRVSLLAEPALATERELQLAVRYTLQGSFQK